MKPFHKFGTASDCVAEVKTKMSFIKIGLFNVAFRNAVMSKTSGTSGTSC